MGKAGGPDSAESRWRTVVCRQGSASKVPSPTSSRLLPWMPVFSPICKGRIPICTCPQCPCSERPLDITGGGGGGVQSSPRPGGRQLGALVSSPGEGPSL